MKVQAVGRILNVTAIQHAKIDAVKIHARREVAVLLIPTARQPIIVPFVAARKATKDTHTPNVEKQIRAHITLNVIRIFRVDMENVLMHVRNYDVQANARSQAMSHFVNKSLDKNIITDSEENTWISDDCIFQLNKSNFNYFPAQNILISFNTTQN